MTLDEYMKNLEEKLQEFKRSYEYGLQNDPDNFKPELEVGEWDEQFEAFLGIMP